MIGSQTATILRDPTRLNESAMGNLVADAMLERYTGPPHEVEAAITNSGGLRQDLDLSAVDLEAERAIIAL